jgi:hypothetical protein
MMREMKGILFGDAKQIVIGVILNQLKKPVTIFAI